MSRETIVKAPELRASQSDAEELLKGELSKKSRHGQWQPRWFELRGTFLYYFSRTNLGPPLCAIDVRRLQGVTTRGREVVLERQRARAYHLRAPSDDDARRWARALLARARDFGGRGLGNLHRRRDAARARVVGVIKRGRELGRLRCRWRGRGRWRRRRRRRRRCWGRRAAGLLL